MRLQTSTEFILILSAVVGFAVFAIGMYMHLAASQSYAFNAISKMASANVPLYNTTYGSGTPYVSFGLPSLSYVNMSNSGYLAVSLPGDERLSLLSLAGTGAQVAPDRFSNASGYSGITVLDFGFVPSAPGQITVSFNALVSDANGTIQRLIGQAVSDAVFRGGGLNGSLGEGLQGTIAVNNESAVYQLSQPYSIYEIKVWGHCPYHNWLWGYILPEKSQCGAGTWGFLQNGYCDQQDAVGNDAYVCVAENATGSGVSTISQTYQRNYSITLSLYNASARMQVNLSSESNSAELDGGGMQYGNAVVMSVNGDGYLPQPSSSYVVLENAGERYSINASPYYAYSSGLSSLLGELGTYNGTWPSQDVYDAVMHMANGTNAGARLLLEESADEGGCAFRDMSFICAPFSQYSYVISVVPDSGSGMVNHSISIGSSLVEIK